MEANVLYQNNEHSETMNTIKQMFYTKTLEDNPVTPDRKLSTVENSISQSSMYQSKANIFSVTR